MRIIQTTGTLSLFFLTASAALTCIAQQGLAQTSPRTPQPITGSTALTAPPAVSLKPSTPETITVRVPQLPNIVLYPHATPTGQPVRTTGAQGRTSGRQYDWGVFNRGNGEAAGFGPVGQYGIAPWAEDWTRISSVVTVRYARVF